MKKSELAESRCRAAVLLACGSTAADAAADSGVGVAAATVRAWLKRPEFATAIENLRAVARNRDSSVAQKVAAFERALEPLKGAPQPGPVTVVLRPGMTPAQRRRAIARAVAKALEPTGGSRRTRPPVA